MGRCRRIVRTAIKEGAVREKIEKHYAEVAQMVRDAGTDEETGFRIVSDTRMACSLADRSEAFNIYDERLVEGIPEKALVASRGCGDPVSQAQLQPGETVLDLGCGGGVDAIIASRLVGDEGKVYGLDMTPEMLALARENSKIAGTRNVDYIEGLIEDIPLDDGSVDVVLSNCVINLSDDRPSALREAARVLKPGGRFVVSDIVEFEPLPIEARNDVCAIAGTTNGMLSVDAYASLLEEAGFSRASIEPKTIYTLDVLREKAERKGRMDSFSRIEGFDISGKTGSVIIAAWR